MELLIFASIGCLKTLILLKDLQSQNLNNYMFAYKGKEKQWKRKKLVIFRWKQKKRANYPSSTLELDANKVNLHSQFTENLLLVAYKQ